MQDGSADPLPGEAYYYLARGTSACSTRAYGSAEGLASDPRAALAISSPCD